MTTKSDRWLLPDGVNEVLPPEAARVEALRRRALDLFDCWGYELIIPPLIEYLDSLLTGSGTDLELQTFKVTDLASGRLLGLRVDMTSQAARIDANVLRRGEVTRLCYTGSVLRAMPPNQFENRCPLVIGAELFGAAGREADIEVITLMNALLAVAAVPQPRIELGHIGIFRALAQVAELTPAVERALFQAVQRKSGPDLGAVLTAAGVSTDLGAAFEALPGLLGGPEVLGRARSVFGRWPTVVEVLDELERIVEGLPDLGGESVLQFDLAELRGYSYHTGVVVSAYTADQGHSLARGGRYDDIGQAFGRCRPATGFDADLLTLAGYSRAPEPASVFAPTWDDPDPALYARVCELRAAGTRVLCGSATDQHGAARCARRLERRDQHWELVIQHEPAAQPIGSE